MSLNPVTKNILTFTLSMISTTGTRKQPGRGRERKTDKKIKVGSERIECAFDSDCGLILVRAGY